MTDMNVSSAAPTAILQQLVNESAGSNQTVVTLNNVSYLETVQNTATFCLETVQNTTASAWNSTASALNSTKVNIANTVEVLHSGASTMTQNAREALSYEGLSAFGRNTTETITHFVGTHTEAPVEMAKAWAQWGTEQITTGAESAKTFTVNNYLPIAAFALGAFTATKAIQKGFENAQAAKAAFNSDKPEIQAQAKTLAGRAFVQIVLGAAAGLFAGSIAYGSPAGVGARNFMSDKLFGSN